MARDQGQLIVLCEGKNDYEFLNSIIKDEMLEISYRKKDFVIRRLHHGLLLARVVVILEEGKTRLLGNIRLLLSKMRSLPGENNVVALIDADHDTPENLIEKIHRDLENLANDKQRFPRIKPKLDIQKEKSNHYVVAVEYGSGALLKIHVVIVPYSLEYWKEHSGLNPETFRDQPWYRQLVSLLQKLGVKTVEDEAQFT